MVKLLILKVIYQELKALQLLKQAQVQIKKSTVKYHTVSSGDQLWAIAEKYYGNGTKYKEIAKLNNIKSPYTIYPGQKLKIK